MSNFKSETFLFFNNVNAHLIEMFSCIQSSYQINQVTVELNEAKLNLLIFSLKLDKKSVNLQRKLMQIYYKIPDPLVCLL